MVIIFSPAVHDEVKKKKLVGSLILTIANAMRSNFAPDGLGDVANTEKT